MYKNEETSLNTSYCNWIKKDVCFCLCETINGFTEDYSFLVTPIIVHGIVDTGHVHCSLPHPVNVYGSTGTVLPLQSNVLKSA